MLLLSNLYANLFTHKYTYIKSVKGAKVYLCKCDKEKRKLKKGKVLAFTIGEYIFVRERKSLNGRTLRHELEHVEQARRQMLFPIRYMACGMLYGYDNNPFELGARRKER